MNRQKAKSTADASAGEKKTQMDVETIRFYRANEKPYGALSNLFRRPVEFEGIVFPTAEHAYQAGKAAKPAVRDWIQSAPTPALAAMAAHGLYTWEVVPNWASIKFERMRRVLRAKFTQHPDLAELLLSTGSARLVEAGRVNSAVNRLWGEVNGNGQNMLGLLLMEVRVELAGERGPATLSGRSSTKMSESARSSEAIL
ncbi:NADAR family protein [Mesorhizobium sp. M0030]|uniref:NADAR family protein n=1 Tax=Mesorhizobium sp. M0030 TaxID=2956851 RepID=UPI003339EBEE